MDFVRKLIWTCPKINIFSFFNYLISAEFLRKICFLKIPFFPIFFIITKRINYQNSDEHKKFSNSNFELFRLFFKFELFKFEIRKVGKSRTSSSNICSLSNSNKLFELEHVCSKSVNYQTDFEFWWNLAIVFSGTKYKLCEVSDFFMYYKLWASILARVHGSGFVKPCEGRKSSLLKRTWQHWEDESNRT